MKTLLAWLGITAAGLVAVLGLRKLRRREPSPDDGGAAARTRTARSGAWFGPPWG